MTLVLYNFQAEFKVLGDASSFGLEAVLFQKDKDNLTGNPWPMYPGQCQKQKGGMLKLRRKP